MVRGSGWGSLDWVGLVFGDLGVDAEVFLGVFEEDFREEETFLRFFFFAEAPFGFPLGSSQESSAERDE
jgi:hypothetical protein